MTGEPRQGEALSTWGIWGALTLVVLATYSWVDPAETYHVSREGLTGGLSRALTFVNFPLALVAIALVLIAMVLKIRQIESDSAEIRSEEAIELPGPEQGIERELRDGIGGVFYSGTSDIQRNIIARSLGL